MLESIPSSDSSAPRSHQSEKPIRLTNICGEGSAPSLDHHSGLKVQTRLSGSPIPISSGRSDGVLPSFPSPSSQLGGRGFPPNGMFNYTTPSPTDNSFGPGTISEIPEIDFPQEALIRGSKDLVVLDDRWELVNPSEDYLTLLALLGVNPNRAGAEVRGFMDYEDKACGVVNHFPNVVLDREAKEVCSQTVPSLNPYLGIKSARESSYKTLERLQSLDDFTDFDLYVSFATLTFPKVISEFIVDNITIRDNKIVVSESKGLIKAWETLKEFRKEFRKHNYITKSNSVMGGLANLHLSKSYRRKKAGNPFESHCHFHLLIPNMALRVSESGKISAHRFHPLGGDSMKRDIQVFRDSWRKALETVFPNFMAQFEGKIYLWLCPYEMKLKEWENRVLHYLAYSRRKWSLDAGKFMEDFGLNAVSYEDLERGKKFIRYRNKTRPFGFWNWKNGYQFEIGIKRTLTALEKNCKKEIDENFYFNSEGRSAEDIMEFFVLYNKEASFSEFEQFLKDWRLEHLDLSLQEAYNKLEWIRGVSINWGKELIKCELDNVKRVSKLSELLHPKSERSCYVCGAKMKRVNEYDLTHRIPKDSVKIRAFKGSNEWEWG